MEQTIVSQLTATIAALRSAGQTGFLILLVLLIIALGLGITAIICQGIVISRFKTIETNIRAVETNIKERTLAVKERDEFRAIFPTLSSPSPKEI